MERSLWRFIFKYMNRLIMVPAYRLGLAPLISNPAIGYIMVLKTTGRKSGEVRYAPVNYAINDGSIYCVAGWGKSTHWFANIKSHPQVEMLLPGRTLAGLAEEVIDPADARRAIISVARSAGLTLAFDGLNPLTATDEQIVAANGWMPVVRIDPTGVGGGPNDPGGWGWPLPLLGILAWLAVRKKR